MAFDAFLKIATIPGESNDDRHKDWIEVLSFHHTMQQPVTGSVSSGGARSAERVNHADFSIVKSLDKASPKLALACSRGEHISDVTFVLCRATGDKQKYMEYKLHEVLITAVRPGGASHAAETLPVEEVCFSYSKIEWTYTETDHGTGKAKGDIKAHWDLKANKGG
jgi:type VI secretion system secreted protein Hcp